LLIEEGDGDSYWNFDFGVHAGQSSGVNMRRFILLSLSFLLFQIPAFSQEQMPGWLSLRRFSLTLNSTYFFNPWDNYNNAVGTVTRQIMLDKFFYEPTGEYEKINGDLLFKAGIGYQILPRFYVSINGQYGSSSAKFEFYPDWSIPPENWGGSVAHKQAFTFNIYSLGLGVFYRYPINEKISISAGGSVDSYTGKMSFEVTHDRWATGPIENEPFVDYPLTTANLEDNSWGWNLDLGFHFKLVGALSAHIGGNYRHVNFSNIRGTGEQHYSETPIGFSTELVKESNYFGLGNFEVHTPEWDWYSVLPPLTFFTEPDEEARTPATIDMSALGIQFGIVLGL
jgi:hypothetical protein